MLRQQQHKEILVFIVIAQQVVMREHSVTGTLQRSRMCVCDVATNLRSQPLVSTALQPELSKLFGDSRLRLTNGSPLLKTACDLPNCILLLLSAFDCF